MMILEVPSDPSHSMILCVQYACLQPRRILIQPEVKFQKMREETNRPLTIFKKYVVLFLACFLFFVFLIRGKKCFFSSEFLLTFLLVLISHVFAP